MPSEVFHYLEKQRQTETEFEIGGKTGDLSVQIGYLYNNNSSGPST